MFAVLQSASSDMADGWDLITSDVSTAFLQGQQEGRDLPLFMRAPSDPLVEATGRFQESPLYLILGNIYGLANAPYLWSLEVRRRFAALGFLSHTLDVMTFYHRAPGTGSIDAICVVHVDDVLAAVSPLFDLEPLKAAFTWGEWSSVRREPITFIGRQIRLRNGTDLIVYQQ